MNLLFMCLILFSVSLTALRLYVHFSYGEKLKNDNCLCSETWKRDIFQYGPFYFMFIVMVLSNIVLINSNLKIYMKYLFRFCSIILTTIYLSYIYELIKIECSCSQDWRRTFVAIYEIFAIIVQLIGIIYFDQNASYFD